MNHRPIFLFSGPRFGNFGIYCTLMSASLHYLYDAMIKVDIRVVLGCDDVRTCRYQHFGKDMLSLCLCLKRVVHLGSEEELR